MMNMVECCAICGEEKCAGHYYLGAALPIITPELEEAFGDTDLMETVDGRLNWTQTAVDFAAALPVLQFQRTGKQ